MAPRQIVVIKDGKRVEPANLDYLPREYQRLPKAGQRERDRYDDMYQRRVRLLLDPKKKPGAS